MYTIIALYPDPDAKSQLIRKNPDDGKDWRQEKGTTEDEIAEWHHWFNGHEFEQAPGDAKRQGSLTCYSPWGCKKSDMSEQQQELLNNSNPYSVILKNWEGYEIPQLFCFRKWYFFLKGVPSLLIT